MEVKKIKVETKKIKDISFQFNNKNILVQPYISLKDRIILSSSYLDVLFLDDDSSYVEKYLVAEDGIILGILDLCTNIEVSEDLDINFVVANGLWEKVSSRIVNYYDFEASLEKMVKVTQENRRSMTGVLGGLIEKILEILKDVDASEDGVKRAVSQFQKQMGSLQETLNFETPESEEDSKDG